MRGSIVVIGRHIRKYNHPSAFIHSIITHKFPKKYVGMGSFVSLKLFIFSYMTGLRDLNNLIGVENLSNTFEFSTSGLGERA
ncbi:hypothetical protein WN51_11254 [Melipona quadrifasciata]|uniref:Uncharacterized protein n=1 Tax=Melipona quadrifasciata TaxID=166423 RepID=A0A0M9A3Q7_9HYME|nr:hypothetical protein WN51_11254 [Melipona quadrifasciata]